MTYPKTRRLIAITIIGLLLPTAAFADVVFDPTNFAQAVLQVEQEVQLVAQFKQQVQNQLAMLQGWGYSQLDGILQSMGVWQQVFDATTYSSTDPGGVLDEHYPSAPGDYAGTSDASIAALRSGWDQRQRQVLIENRTVQNQTYLGLEPTAQRIGQYVQRSNAAPGVTAAMQAGNEELATLVAQLQTLQAQEITDARGEVEQAARVQAEEAYGDQQRRAVRAGWESPPPPSNGLVNAFPLAGQ